MNEFFGDVPNDIQDKLVEATGGTLFVKQDNKLLHAECEGLIQSSPMTLSYLCSTCDSRWTLSDIKRIQMQKRQ